MGRIHFLQVKCKILVCTSTAVISYICIYIYIWLLGFYLPTLVPRIQIQVVLVVHVFGNRHFYLLPVSFIDSHVYVVYC